MPWMIRRIGNNKERVADAVRKALEAAIVADKDGGRGYRSAATAVEQALQAFGNVNGYGIEVDTSGDIAVDGAGYLTITVRTISQDVMV